MERLVKICSDSKLFRFLKEEITKEVINAIEGQKRYTFYHREGFGIISIEVMKSWEFKGTPKTERKTEVKTDNWKSEIEESINMLEHHLTHGREWFEKFEFTPKEESESSMLVVINIYAESEEL